MNCMTFAGVVWVRLAVCTCNLIRPQRLRHCNYSNSTLITTIDGKISRLWIPPPAHARRRLDVPLVCRWRLFTHPGWVYALFWFLSHCVKHYDGCFHRGKWCHGRLTMRSFLRPSDGWPSQLPSQITLAFKVRINMGFALVSQASCLDVTRGEFMKCWKGLSTGKT